ncbi:MAG: hypothetical protein MI756_08230 [Chromatiales bacterium]|nr:hypothetical protein [Chromatiales bacterium]
MNNRLKPLAIGAILAASITLTPTAQAHDLPYGLLGGVLLGLHFSHGHYHYYGHRHDHYPSHRRSDSHGYRHRDRHKHGHRHRDRDRHHHDRRRRHRDH